MRGARPLREPERRPRRALPERDATEPIVIVDDADIEAIDPSSSSSPRRRSRRGRRATGRACRSQAWPRRRARRSTSASRRADPSVSQAGVPGGGIDAFARFGDDLVSGVDEGDDDARRSRGKEIPSGFGSRELHAWPRGPSNDHGIAYERTAPSRAPPRAASSKKRRRADRRRGSRSRGPPSRPSRRAARSRSRARLRSRSPVGGPRTISASRPRRARRHGRRTTA